MTHFRQTLFLLFALVGSSAQAQLHSEPRDAMDGGSWQGCDTSLLVSFTAALEGPLTYRFSPDVTPGSTAPYSTVWSVFDGIQFDQYFIDSLTYTFPLPGEHLVCLTVNAIDMGTMAPCSTTTCQFVDILQDESCAELVVDFTIGAISGQGISFQDLSTFSTIVQRSWSFGDGGTGTGSSPTHNFTTSGPHQVCLTVVGGPPIGCVGSICQWLYLGPAPVDCEVLFTPGYLLIQQDGLVGVLDTSTTSGMNNTTSWDFGDGSPVEHGRFAIHVYEQYGNYELCSTVRTWGPLLADTCVNTLCKTLNVDPAVGIGDYSDELIELKVWPVPFSDRLFIKGLPTGSVSLALFDPQGRLITEQTAWNSGQLELGLGDLASGIYLLRARQGDVQGRARILKE